MGSKVLPMATILNISSHSLESFIHYKLILQALSLSLFLPSPITKLSIIYSFLIVLLLWHWLTLTFSLNLFYSIQISSEMILCPFFFFKMHLYPKCTIQHSRETVCVCVCVCVSVYVCVCVCVCVCVGMRDSLVQCTGKIRLGDTECLSRW